MKCPRCEVENDAGARFCEDCGARLEATCPSCGTPVTPGKKFCRSCGAALTTEPAGGFASPESYTPKHLAEKILTSKAALEGERKQVTVLFADLKGSMELLADRDPEEARKLLDPVLEHMMEAVHRYEGTVNQVMGDGIMALFGAPLAHEDHAVRACYAALRMQESVKRYAEGVRREQGVTIRIRVGLNSGEVVVRAIGSDLHMDYTAVGQTTHLAARMEQLADPGATLLTAETLALAEGFVQVTSLGPMAVKGLSAPVEVYELAGVSAARSRLQAAATRGLSHFVGRDAEIEQLRRAVDQARQGRGQVAAVVGAPGVGKSRLTFELTHSPQFEGWLMLQAGAVSYGKGTSYLPVIDLLKTYFRIGDRESPHEIREKVTGRLLMLDRALEATLPAILALLDVSGDDPQWQALDPPQRRQRMLDAVKRLLLREAQVQPLLVVFEDLHWIDSETQALLDSLVESLPPARLLLFVNYRPEYEHRWGSKTSYTQLRLDPLPPESAFELLRGLLGEDGTIEPLTPILIERTEGNPFFLEETVRALVETKALVGERGAYRLAKVLTDIQVPPTVQAILAARIDRLSPEDKRLLQSAAVIGKDVPFALLAAIAEEREEELRRGLARLQAAEFLYETSLFPDLEYTFKHALTHEVAYGTLLQDRPPPCARRPDHRGDRGALSGPPRGTDRTAGPSCPAWTDLGAGRRLLSPGRPAGPGPLGEPRGRDVLRARARRVDASAGSPRRPGGVDRHPSRSAERAAALERLRGDVRPPAGGRETRRRLERSSPARSGPRRISTAYYFNANMPSEAETAGQLARAIADELGDVPLQVMAHFFLGLSYLYVCRYQESIAALTWNMEALSGAQVYERLGEPGLPAVISRSYLLRALAEVGQFSEGVVRGDEAVQLSEATDPLFSLASALEGLGYVHLRRGEIPRATALLERGLQICAEWQFLIIYYPIAAYLGSAYALAGRDDEAQSLLERSVAIDAGLHPVLRVTLLGEAHLLAGRLVEAQRYVERALAVAEVTEERGNRGWAVRLLAEIAARRDPPNVDEAEARYRDALAVAQELGMRPLVAHCHLGLGKLYRRTGKHERAREHLMTATTMYREMDMRFWLEQAEAELPEVA